MNHQLIQGVSIHWDKIDARSYLRGIESLKGLQHLQFKKPITFFVGENGSGKSTMLEALAVAAGFNPEGGTKNYSFSTYDSHSELCEAVRLERGPGAQIYTFDDEKIHECEYEDTDSYQVTEMFINNREAILHRLLET